MFDKLHYKTQLFLSKAIKHRHVEEKNWREQSHVLMLQRDKTSTIQTNDRIDARATQNYLFSSLLSLALVILKGNRIDLQEKKMKRSDSVLLQKPLHPQKNPKSNVTTQKRNQKLRLHNDCGPT